MGGGVKISLRFLVWARPVYSVISFSMIFSHWTGWRVKFNSPCSILETDKTFSIKRLRREVDILALVMKSCSEGVNLARV